MTGDATIAAGVAWLVVGVVSVLAVGRLVDVVRLGGVVVELVVGLVELVVGLVELVVGLVELVVGLVELDEREVPVVVVDDDLCAVVVVARGTEV